MQFGLTESQQVMKNSAREFFPAECPPAEVRRIMETSTAHDDKLWRKIAAQGWCGIVIPEEYDGLGNGMVELAVSMEEIGRALIPGPFLSTIAAGAVIDATAEEPFKRKYLPAIASGELIATAALDKNFVPDAAVAGVILTAETDGIYAYESGVETTPMPVLDMTRKLYRIDTSNAQGMRIGGAQNFGRAIDIATMALCAEMTGGMQRMLDQTVEYAKTRKQFGRPIGQFQAVQMMCADMLVLTESSRSAAYYAAYSLEHETREESAIAVSVAKSYASDAYREVGNKAIQVHGGMGFTWENDLHLYYRRAKACEVMFGDARTHRERIAAAVIERS
jgi:alkylation response protein AidB-like acyl-CoA dehydrogenase